MISTQDQQFVSWLIYASLNLVLILVIWGILSWISPVMPDVESLKQLFRTKLGDWIVLYPELGHIIDALVQTYWRPFVAILSTVTLNTVPFFRNFLETGAKSLSNRLFPPRPTFIGDPPPMSDPLDFTSKQIRFVGRKEELRQLDEFLRRPEPFLWWFMTGGAGIGKSRLAWKWVLEVRKRRHHQAGFYQGGFTPEWCPQRTTVIVVDNAAEYVDDILNMLDSFTQTCSQWRYRLRLLLLERAVPEPLKVLREQDKYWRYRYQDTLVLESLHDDEIRCLVGNELQDEAQISKIIRVSERNPLLALAAKELLRKKGDLQWQDRFELLEAWAERMADKYKKIGLEEYALRLLALATFTYGLPLEAARDYIGGERKLPSKEILEDILQQPVDDPIPAIAPDLFGEAFVLYILERFYADERKDFIRRGWDANPQGVVLFLLRLLHDFPKHSLTQELLDAPPEGITPLMHWCSLRVALIYVYGEEKRLAELGEVLGKLEGVAKAHEGEAAIQVELAKGYVNALNAYGEAGALVELGKVLRKLEEVAKAHEGEAAIQVLLASGYVNAIGWYGEKGELAKLGEVLRKLEGVAEAHEGEAAIQVELAKGYVNALTDYGKAGALVELGEVLRKLEGVAKAHKGEAAIQVELAKGYVNALASYAKAWEVEMVAVLRRKLLDLLRRYSSHPRFRDFGPVIEWLDKHGLL